MPKDKTAGAPGEKQDGAEMFRWERNAGRWDCHSRGAKLVGHISLGILGWDTFVVAEDYTLSLDFALSFPSAKRSVEAFWRAAAKTAKELGL